MRTIQYLNLNWNQPEIENVLRWRLNVSGQDLVIEKSNVVIDGNSVSYQLITLPNGDSFNFETNYTLSITAIGSNDQESTPSNAISNYFIAEDINGDGSVDGLDLLTLATKFGETAVNYREFADINADGNIDGLDLSALANNFGATKP